MRFLSKLQWLLLSLWLGSMVGFGVLMAPVLFEKLPTRQAAGDVAGEIIWRLLWFGIVAAGFVVVLRLLSRRLDWIMVATVLIAGLLLFNATYVWDNLDRIQTQMDRPIDEYAVTDPLRVEYNRWHSMSNYVGMGAVLLGLVTLLGWRDER